jgi:hypothetical protein
MNLQNFATACVAALLLTACSNSSEPLAPPQSQPESAIAGSHRTVSGNLLYVANTGDNVVDVYPYSNGYIGKKTQTISITDPTGVCTDRTGDVYVASYQGHRVTEFEHGSTTPKSKISFTAYPYACAVDQLNGDLAVSVQTPHGKFFRGADVQVFANGSGRPRKYNAEDGFAQVYFMAYDNKHDLFATGEPCNEESYCNYGSNGGPPGLFELTPGAESFNELSLGKTTLHEPTGLAWIKPTLLVVDADYNKQGNAEGLKVFVDSSGATVVAMIPLSGTQLAQGVAVRADVALVADQQGDAVRSYSVADGTLLSTLNQKNQSPMAVAVSESK